MLPCFRAAAASRESSCSCSQKPGFPGKVGIRQSKREGEISVEQCPGFPGWEIPLHIKKGPGSGARGAGWQGEGVLTVKSCLVWKAGLRISRES